MAAPEAVEELYPLPIAELQLLREVALEAGEIGMKFFHGENEVWFKPGDSPVSQADKEIDAHLHERLMKERPSYGWLSEEREDDGKRLGRSRSFIVDPIDGTRGFIDGRKEWCISIALVEGDRPIAGVLHAPAVGRTFLASRGNGITLEGLSPEKRTAGSKPLFTGSKKIIRLMENEAQSSFQVLPFIPSLAYRLALVAIGELDGAVSRPGASEWDVAAADVILREADCLLCGPDGRVPRYNQKTTRMGTLLAARRDRHGEFLTLAKTAGILQKT